MGNLSMALRHYVTSVNKEVFSATRLSNVRILQIIYSLFSQQLEYLDVSF